MKYKLSAIADVSLGQTFRGKAEASDKSSGIKLVQIKDIKEGTLSTESLTYADFDKKKLKVRILNGDLLLPLRGSRYEVSILNIDDEEEIVTTTNQVAIIRPDLKKVSMKFLLCFFNSSIGRSALRRLNTGTTIPQINRNQLASLEIEVPNKIAQMQLVELYENWFEQKRILQEIIENGEQLVERAYAEILKGKVD